MAKSYFDHYILKKIGIDVPFSQMFHISHAFSIDMRLNKKYVNVLLMHIFIEFRP